MDSLKEALNDWCDFDDAAYVLAQLLGLILPEATFQESKHLFRPYNTVGNLTHEMLQLLAKRRFLQYDAENLRYRWGQPEEAP